MKQTTITVNINKYKKWKKSMIDYQKKFKYVKFHKKIHPFLRKILFVKRTLLGQNLTILNDKSSIIENNPIIFAVTHIGKYDFEMVMESLNSYFYALSGDWELMYNTIDDYFHSINGVFYVDTEDKQDRHNSYELNVLALKQGIRLLWFPEGIWNLSDHLPMQNLYPGIIKAALETNTEIVPIAVDQRENDFYVNISENINANKLESDKVIALRDIMASLKWEIWEQFEIENRKDIPEDYYERFLKIRLREWPQFNMDIIQNRVYKDKNITEASEVYSFLEKLDINKNNAFLFKKR